MGTPLRSITQAEGLVIEPDELGDILDGQRRRFVSTFGAFDNARWQQPSRCSRWNAHEVFRHLTDAAEVHLAGFTRVRGRFVLDGEFDPNVTPGQWLAMSDDEPPDGTLERYDRAARSVRDHAVTELPKHSDRTVIGPYGPAHWSTITAHIAWDAWLHERDILLHDGSPTPSVDVSGAADERRLVGLYSVLMATVPGVLTGSPSRGGIVLRDDSPLHAQFGSADGAVEVHECAGEVDSDLEGDLLAVADSIAGRGSPLHEVLCGPSDIVDSFAALGLFLRGSDPVSDS